jgi:hypothetical protein
MVRGVVAKKTVTIYVGAATIHHMHKTLILPAVAALSLGLASPAFAATGEPVADGTGAIYRSAEWVKGAVGFNQEGYYWGSPPIYSVRTYAMSGVEVPNAPVTAGQIFYIHAWAGLVTPVSASDTAVPSLGLPEGVSVVPASEARTYCYVSKTDYVPIRDPGCPVFTAPAAGASIPLGTYPLFAYGSGDGSEVVDMFIPVRASGPISGQNVFISTQMLSTPSRLPNPLYGDAPLNVAPGSGGTGTGTGTGGGAAPGLVPPANPKYAKRGKAMVITWDAVSGATSYRARLKVGKKWTKWATLDSNGVKLTKLKKGKKYVLQVQAAGGPTSTWRFRAK